MNMKIIAVIAATFCVTAAAATFVILNNDSSNGEIILSVSDSMDLSKDMPEDVQWKCTDTRIVAVSSAGVITAVGQGNCKVTATSSAGKVLATYPVKVNVPSDGEKDVEIVQDDMTLAVGQSVVLSAYVTPSTYDQKVKWASTEDSVASIDQNGTVTAVAVGKCKITAYSDAVKDTADMEITVTENGSPPPSVDVDVNILEEDMTLNPGDSVALTAVVTPAGSDNRIVWVSSNTAVAVVSNNGTVIAVAQGKAEITALNPASGEDDDITIKVRGSSPTPVDDDVEVYPDDVYIKPGEKRQLTANQDVRWRSTNTAVATVDESGLVTAVSNGECEIIAYTDRDSEDADIYVSDGGSEIRDIEIVNDDITLAVGGKQTLIVQIYPKTALQAVTWRSTNTDVATVDENGLVTAVGVGECEIIATASDGRHSDDADVEVTQGGGTIRDVEIVNDDDVEHMAVGQVCTLTAEVYPLTADQHVTWRSTNTDVATVDENGLVTAVSVGECEIIATASDGRHSDDADVEVN